MRGVPKNVLNLPLAERALKVLRAAVKEAITERARAGQPVYVWSGGRVVKLSREKLRAYLRPKSTNRTPKQKGRSKGR